MIFTEVMDIEEVRDDKGALLYVEYLVAVWDRDEKDIPAAKVLGSEKVRIAPDTSTVFSVVEVDSATESVNNETTAQRNEDIERVVGDARTRVYNRVINAEKAKKWRAGPLSNS